MQILSRIMVALVLVGSAHGQGTSNPAPPDAQTKLEAFLATTRNLIVKDFYSIGTLNGTLGSVVIDAVVLSVPGHPDRRG